MPLRAERYLGTSLFVVTTAWVAGAAGVAQLPWAVLATTAAISALVLIGLRRGLRWPVQLSWLAALLAWLVVGGLVRPVAPGPAAAAAAVAAIAILIALAAQDLRVRAAAHPALASAAFLTATWMLVERTLVGHRPAGPFGNPNPAATVVLLGLAVAPWLRTSAAVRVGVVLTSAAALVASGSRAAMVGAVAVAASWVIARGSARLRAAAAVLAVVVVGGLAVRLATDRDPLRFERLRIWGVAVRTVMAEFPLGAGPGGYVDAALPHNFPRIGEFALYYRVPGSAESDPLQLSATLGLPGMAVGAALLLSVLKALRRAGTVGWGVAAALLVTSGVHSQLMFPAVAWTATLALAGCGRPLPGRRIRTRLAPAAALLAGIAAPCAAALGLVSWPPVDPTAPARSVSRLTQATLEDDAALADLEAEAWLESRTRPRFAHAWRVLGTVRLSRAELRGDPLLIAGAVEAYAAAQSANPLDVWAAVGLGQAFHLAGQPDQAVEAFRSALAIEPNCVAAWLELGRLHLQAGEVTQASDALRHAEVSIDKAKGVRAITNYQQALAAADPSLLAMLRHATGAR